MGVLASLVGLAAVSAGCDANFIDLRDPAAIARAQRDDPIVIRLDGGSDPLGAAGSSPDAGFVDGGAFNSAGAPVSTDDTLTAVGSWGGRSNYRAAGQASYVLRPDGVTELRFSDDFSVSRVPGPLVVITARPTIGRGGVDPNAGDVPLGTLRSERGSQVYEVPAGAEDRLYVWVYCDPFSVEVARAELVVQ